MNLRSSVYYYRGYLANKKLHNPPIIIGGCERSGTSLLQSVISAHPSIYAIGEETWAFCYGHAAGFNSKKNIRILRLYKALGRSNIPSSCNRWCEKSPANIFYFDSILEYFKNKVKLIYIIRDGRDVVTSIHPSNKSKPWVSIDRWLDVAEKGYQYRECDQVLTIKYEDLILNFDTTVKSICEHAGVSVEDQIMNWHKYAKIKKSKNLIGNTVEKISKESIGKFDSNDFKHRNIVEKFLLNDKAMYFLKLYNYI